MIVYLLVKNNDLQSAFHFNSYAQALNCNKELKEKRKLYKGIVNGQYLEAFEVEFNFKSYDINYFFSLKKGETAIVLTDGKFNVFSHRTFRKIVFMDKHEIMVFKGDLLSFENLEDIWNYHHLLNS